MPFRSCPNVLGHRSHRSRGPSNSLPYLVKHGTSPRCNRRKALGSGDSNTNTRPPDAPSTLVLLERRPSNPPLSSLKPLPALSRKKARGALSSRPNRTQWRAGWGKGCHCTGRWVPQLLPPPHFSDTVTASDVGQGNAKSSVIASPCSVFLFNDYSYKHLFKC